MELCRVRNVSDTLVVCIFKNLPRVHCNIPVSVQHRLSCLNSMKTFVIEQIIF